MHNFADFLELCTAHCCFVDKIVDKSGLERGRIECLDEFLRIDMRLGNLRFLILLNRTHEAADFGVIKIERSRFFKFGICVIDDTHGSRADHGLKDGAP